ncbi:MAG: hypothetical protein AMXMBFR12_00880 [Candidatus Babeliales bacterium]
MSKTTLFLIRHGQTDWNLAGKLQGQADIPLNATGKAQAQKVAQFLKKKQASLNALYSSDLQRAHQTAQEIAAIFALEIILAADLREGHFGKLQGLTKQERSDRYGLLKDEELLEKVGAEPRDKVVVRVMNYLHGIVQKHKRQHIAVVTHGWLLDSLLTHLGHNVAELPALTNESITIFTWYEDRQMFVFESIEHAD